MMGKAEDRAIKVLQEVRIHAPPVPVEQIAKAYGVAVRYQAFKGDVSGMLYRDGPNSVIGINASDVEVRQRYTIAHELGHLFLHPGRDVWVDRNVRVNFRNAESGLAVNYEEIQANAFAAELLMPWKWVIDEATMRVRTGQAQNVRQLIESLSKQFLVSRPAMEYRLINLGLIDPEPGRRRPMLQ
jgi:Zn-dependent peptidase ImmA (M78 family)